MYPPGNGGCGGKIQEKNSLLVHDSKLQTMIECHLKEKRMKRKEMKGFEVTDLLEVGE